VITEVDLSEFSGIDKQEYRQRVARLQQAMTAADLNALLVYSWKRGQVRYIAGYHPNYIANVAMVILPREGPPAMCVRFPFDLGRARRESWIEDVKASGDLPGLAKDAAQALAQQGIRGGRVGLAGGDHVIDELPHSLYIALQRALPDAELIEACHLLQDQRQTKSPAELALLRESACLAEAGAQAARQALHPGIKEYEVVAAIEARLRHLGAETHLVVIASQGDRESIGPPEDKPIQSGAAVVVELAVQKGGYWTQVARTFLVGGATAEQLQIYTSVYQAYQAGVAAARPNRTCSDVAQAMQTALEHAGYSKEIEHDFGHGIGLDLPELPKIDLGNKTVIQPDTVLVIHPGVRLPSIGAAFLGGTVLVGVHDTQPLHTIPPTPYTEG
jgi:Xaa-Pro aminopeptidase